MMASPKKSPGGDANHAQNSPAIERYLAIGKVLHARSRAAYEWFTTFACDQRAVRLVWREGDVLAVATRYGPDGGPQVLFASGSDGVEALLSLAGLMGDEEQWRVDKPFGSK